jgi:hypothetical protein
MHESLKKFINFLKKIKNKHVGILKILIRFNEKILTDS